MVLLLALSAAASVLFAFDLHLNDQVNPVDMMRDRAESKMEGEAGEAGAIASENDSMGVVQGQLQRKQLPPMFTILFTTTSPPPPMEGVKEFTRQSCPDVNTSAAPLAIPPGASLGYQGQGLPQRMRVLLQDTPDALVVKTIPRPHWLHVVSSSGDDHPTNAMRRDKMWEPGLTVLIRWAFEVGCSKEDCLVVDIGMNIGWYTALSAAHGKNVLAFEPNPAPLLFGNKTADLNEWRDRVRIVNAGLSQDNATLYVRPQLANSGSRAAERSSSRNSIKVPSHRLDDLIEQYARICFLKADCQGCEADAFLSGTKLIGEGNIRMVPVQFLL